MAYFIEDLELKHLAYSPVFEDDWDDAAFDLLESEYTKIIELLQKHPDVRVKHLKDAAINDGKRTVGNLPCGAGRFYVAFSIDGFVYPCHRFNKHGKTTAQRFEDVTRIGEPADGTIKWIHNKWRSKFNDGYEEDPKCKGCAIHNVTCDGVCPAVNYDLTGNIFRKPDRVCKFYEIENRYGRMLTDTYVQKRYTKNVLTVGMALMALADTAPEAEKKILNTCIELLKKEYTNGIR